MSVPSGWLVLPRHPAAAGAQAHERLMLVAAGRARSHALAAAGVSSSPAVQCSSHKVQQQASGQTVASAGHSPLAAA